MTLGETACEKLKTTYFNDDPWQECYKLVAQKFTLLKDIMRKFYADKTYIEILIALQKYSCDDIADVLCGTPEELCEPKSILLIEKNQTNS